MSNMVSQTLKGGGFGPISNNLLDSTRSPVWGRLREFLQQEALLWKNMDDLMEQLPVHEVADYITQEVYPRQQTLPGSHMAGNQFIGLMRRMDVTGSMVIQVMAHHLHVVRSGEGTSPRFLAGFTGLLRNPRLSVSLMGSLCRQVDAMAGPGSRIAHVENSIMYLRWNESAPVELLARMLVEAGDLPSLAESARMDARYPELAGLPLDLKRDAVAVQPFPDEWYQDVWMPAEQVRPAGTVEIIDLWEEMVASR